MPDWLTAVILVLYGSALCFIFLYSMVQLHVLIRYHRRKLVLPVPAPEYWPEVLVQLPVYNERYVVQRLIDTIARLDYPAARLHIQVLDDSTDGSEHLARERVAAWRSKGIDIAWVRRPHRQGFKAGALAYGLSLNQYPFVAIFDADFLPAPDFLKRTVPLFSQDDRIGAVQTRWGHLNRDYSLLTRLQAFGLDAHFTVEQAGRNALGAFINFNGTAGIWRRSCIDDAGGWSPDTLTEDLDLSYRAQLRGWRFVYREDVEAPAELPAGIVALKNQQYRWNKGAAECARKHLIRVLKQADLSWTVKAHATFHLLNSSVFIFVALCALLSLPMMYIKETYPALSLLFLAGSGLIFSFVILGVYYYISFLATNREKPGLLRFIYLYTAFLSFSMGLSLHNSRAVLQGLAGKRTPFLRTPKWNIVHKGDSWTGKQYHLTKIPLIAWIEGAMILYFAGAIAYGIAIGEFGFLLLHGMLLFGFAAIFYYSVKQALSL